MEQIKLQNKINQLMLELDVAVTMKAYNKISDFILGIERECIEDLNKEKEQSIEQKKEHKKSTHRDWMHDNGVI